VGAADRVRRTGCYGTEYGGALSMSESSGAGRSVDQYIQAGGARYVSESAVRPVVESHFQATGPGMYLSHRAVRGRVTRAGMDRSKW
jgi:hypothetical protein